MKKFVFITMLLFLTNTIHAQWQLQPIIGVSHSVSLFGAYKTDKVALITNYNYHKTYYVTNIAYLMTKINLGTTMVHENYSLMFSGHYQFFNCKQQLAASINIKEKNSLKSHLIGLTISNRLRETKTVRPFFSLELSTEIGTNYKNEYLRAEDYDPVSYSHDYSMPGSTAINYYQSTPFISTFLAGCDFRLYQGLSINTAFGYGLRVIKVQHGKLYYHPSVNGKPIKEEKIGTPYTLPVNYLTLQLGLSYAFDISKKKTKTEML